MRGTHLTSARADKALMREAPSQWGSKNRDSNIHVASLIMMLKECLRR